jgi:hypothetical protein
MAKGPGPILALAGLGALFMMTRKGGTATITDPGDFESLLDDLDEEEVQVEEESPPPASGGTSGSRGGGTASNPPNISGDPKGYNSAMWQTPRNVREILKMLGYSITVNDTPVKNNAAARKFQGHYNLASKGGMTEQVPGGPAAALVQPGTLSATGTVLEDGTMGKHSLNALEIIATQGTPGFIDPDILGGAWARQFGL